MIHIYTGNGKGKTTQAFGLAIRASGQNLKVIIFQFLKPKSLLCGEEVSVRKIKGVKLVKFDHVHPIFCGSRGTLRGEHKKLKMKIRKDFKRVCSAIFSGKYDMVVLDEIINVVDQDFLSHKSFLKLLESIPSTVEVILTGRGDISSIENYADYVTIMIDKKHPFRKNIDARRGIEY